MADKTQPLGVCDYCLGLIPENRWYTSKGKPRLYCCRQCRNAGNSRVGEPVRYQKMMQNIENGTWRNPAAIRPPTSAEQADRARKGRLREVAAGTWRNPALSDSARKKLSRPRKHSGHLHAAIEKLRYSKMADLSAAEQDAYRQYRARLRKKRKQMTG